MPNLYMGDAVEDGMGWQSMDSVALSRFPGDMEEDLHAPWIVADWRFLLLRGVRLLT